MGAVSQAPFMRTAPTPPPLRGSSPPLKGRGLFATEASTLCGQCALLLGWRPVEFWEATPAELACVLAAYAPHNETPPDAADLQRLMELFPDAPTGGE